jgi:phospholipase/carboxylesterase
MNRRSFLTIGAAGAATVLAGARRGFGQAPAAGAPADPGQDEIPYGQTRLAITDDERQGTVYVPKAYKHGNPLPLLLMLHGFGGSGDRTRGSFTLAEELGIIVIAPDSRDLTWGQSSPGFDPDSRYISQALRAVTGYLDVDVSHVGIGGQSDGATYAFSMGLAYGDTFSHLLIFSEGIPIPYRKQGKPKIFIGHGTNDVQMPIDRTSRRFVPQLKAEGYDITYREYEGGHGTPQAIVREGFQWFVTGRTIQPLL